MTLRTSTGKLFLISFRRPTVLICRYQRVMRMMQRKSLPCFVHLRPSLCAECSCKVRNCRMCRAVDRSSSSFAVIALISCFLIFVEKSYLGSKFGRMLPLTSLSASPSRYLNCGFKSMVLELLNSTSRDECAPDKKHSSFQHASLALTSCLL